MQKRLLVSLSLVAILLMPSFVADVANVSAGGGDVTITQVDISKFPSVSAYVAVSDGKGKHISGLDKQSFGIEEDGQPVSVTRVSDKPVGVQIGIILDASGSTVKVRSGGVSRLDKAKEAINHLLLGYQGQHWFSKNGRSDWVSVLVPTGKESFSTIVPWTTDGGKAYNTVYIYRPPKGITDTPLFKMVFAAIANFDNPKVPQGLQRSLLVFSDGVDVVSEIDLQDAVARAQKKHVKIYTVLLGDPNSKAARNLKRLSTLTNGSYYPLKGPGSLSPLWDEITSMGNQYVLTYHSSLHASGTHEVKVSVQTKGGILQSSTAVSLILQPPQVTIVEPTANAVIERKTDNPKLPMAEIEPKRIKVSISWKWPDGHPRTIKRVDYMIGETKFPVEKPPFDQFQMDISALPPGTYSIQVQVVDELGQVGVSNPVPITINIQQPPTPVPEEMKKVVTQIVKEKSPLTPISYLALAVGLLSLALAVYLYFRKPEVVSATMATIATTVKTVTEPFFLDKKKGPKGKKAKAYLVVLEGEASGHRTIPLVGEHVRLGRDPSLTNVSFTNKTVSRLHARISQEPDGSLYIYDEGSTSGTYVNYEQVPMNGQRLYEGDIINLGQVEMKFTFHQPGAPVTDSTMAFERESLKKTPGEVEPEEEELPGGQEEAPGQEDEASGQSPYDTQPFAPTDLGKKK